MPSWSGQAPALAFSMLALAVFAGGQRAYAYDGGLAAGGFLDALDYKVDLDACQLLTPQARDDLANNRPLDYSIDKIKREVMGFQVGATDVRIHVKPSRIDADRILLDIDVKGKNVAVDSAYFHKKFARLDVDTIYGVYDARADRITVHIPLATAFSLAFIM